MRDPQQSTRHDRASAKVLLLRVSIAGLLSLMFCTREARDPLAALADESAKLPHRLLAGRLHGFAYAPPPLVNRSGTVEIASSRALSAMRLAAATLLQSPLPPGAKASHVAGVSSVVNGQLERAVELMHDSVAREPRNARVWSDVAAVLCDQGLRANNPLLIAQSVGAADRALRLEPAMPEAAFNRALALQGLSLDGPASRALRYYLTLDTTSPWAEEARNRLTRLQITDGGTWTDAVARLRNACAGGEKSQIQTIVDRFPQQARTWGEGVFLAEWARHIEKRSPSEASAALNLARCVGMALKARNGEALLEQAVGAIDDAARRGDSQRIADLARGHALYAEGRIALNRRGSEAASRALKESARRFTAGASPMRFLAASFEASALFDSDRATASRMWRRLAAEVPAAYAALHAQLLWLRATATGTRGELHEASRLYRESTVRFEALGERDNAARTASFGAHALTRLGQRAEAWRMHQSAFAAASREEESLLDVVVSEAALSEVVAKNWDVVRSLLLLTQEGADGSPRRRVDALRWIAWADAQTGFDEKAKRALEDAKEAARALQDPALRDSAVQDVSVIEAQLIGDHSPAAATKLLSEAIEFASRRQDHVIIPALHYQRALIQRRAGRKEEARADLERAVETIEASRSAITAHDIRDSYLGTADDVYRELFDVLDSADATEQAFATAERARARLILDRLVGTTTFPRLTFDRIDIPRRTLVIQYNVLSDRTVLYAFGDSGFTRRVAPVGIADLSATIDTLRRAISGNDVAGAQATSMRLFDVLLAPLRAQLGGCDSIVVVPDGIIDAVPFAALLDRRTRRYVIEGHELTYAPSVSAYVLALSTPKTRSTSGALVVGDPAFDNASFPSLSRLRASRDEARAVAALYPGTEALTDEQATPARFLQKLSAARLVHVSAHAILNAADPGHSALLLASGHDTTGLLYLRDIASQRTPAELVALIGCQTGISKETAATVSSLALAFVAAGTRNVVSTLFDVEDDIARRLSELFHAELVRGATPAEALRSAQLRMLHSADPQLRRIGAWSAFQIYGPGD